MDFISYGKQDISSDDIKSVVSVLESDFLTQGPVVSQFEKSLSYFTGAKHAVAVNSATSALHIACLALEVEEGDLVWTTPITFVASANCARYCGADIDFVDIDPKTYNMSPAKLEEKLIEAKSKGMLPKVVIPVHLAGQSCEMEEIFKLSKEYGFSIIEDASHAVGAKYQGTPVGDCKYSDIAIFSFHPVKIVTTGEGGAALTKSDKLAQKMRMFASHCVTRDPGLMQGESGGAWYYQQVGLGFNYRMTDIQAALGVSQMTRLEAFVAKRQEWVKRYNDALADLNIVVPFQHPDTYSAFHLYIGLVENRNKVFDHLRANNIGVNVHYIPVHTQPYYKELGFKKGNFPNAEEYYEKALTLPIFPTMTDEQFDYVISKLKEAL